MSIYNADGSLRISVRDGLSYTGLYAADQSINVVVASGATPAGMHHPSGAWWVTVSPGGIHGYYAPDGSIYVQETPFTTGGLKVTVITGSLGGGGPAVESWAEHWYWWA